MKKTKAENQVGTSVEQIKDFVSSSNGLKIVQSPLTDYLVIEQKLDQRKITLNCFDVEEVMARQDETGKCFLQVNFASGKKILITENLVGFRPLGLYGLDMDKLPKVVTTPDIQSVFEAIQEALQSNDEQEELDVLRKVYDSVLCGGESVGFDLKEERKVLARIPARMWQASA